MAKIFVGNFSFAIDDEKLRTHFSTVGSVVSAKVMKEGQGGRSRGFGFVEYSSAEDAQKAIKEIDGTVWEGRVVKVSEDRSNRRGDHDGGAPRESGEEGGESRSAPMGYFRAQPLDLGLRKKRKSDPFTEDKTLTIDYKDPRTLQRFMSERGRILPRRMTGLTAHNQRMVTRAVKRAQHLALLPITKS